MSNTPPKFSENECNAYFQSFEGLVGGIKAGMGIPSEYFDAIAEKVRELSQILPRMNSHTFPDATALDAFSLPRGTALKGPTREEIDECLIAMGLQPRNA